MNARGEAGPRSAQSELEIMTRMKKILLLATILAITALTSCTEDTYVGEQNLKAINEGAISFGSATPAVTRASGGDAATLLNNNFVLFGYKTLSSETQTVFDNYQVNYVANTAHTTESNTADWEYVSYKNLQYGTGTKPGEDIVLNDKGVAYNANYEISSGVFQNIEQSIKYWDFSASQYDFFAYSLGAGATGESTTWAKASKLDKTGYGEGSTNPGYTLEGTKAQLGTCYISNKKTVNPAIETTQVQLDFRSFLSKIQLKFYETIPGYSVKDVKFYIDGSTKSTGDADNDGLKPAIYGAANAIPTGGKYTITFNSANQALATLTGDASSSTSSVLFDEVSSGVWLSAFAAKEYEETVGTQFLARASNTATSTKQMTVLPNSNGATLTLKVDFTLVSRDKTGETIEVTGATATVPAAYTQWKPNYAYTYIFKISDDTNVQSGTVTGLYPITLDAVVADSQDGTQETITTVSEPSITSYAKASAVLTDGEYLTGSNIYLVVEDGATNPVLTVGTNAKLYTATLTNTKTSEDVGYHAEAAQSITEATVANALIHGTESPSGTWTVTDANNWNLVVSSSNGLTAATAIPAADSPTGVDLAVNCAKFTPGVVGTYVFEYIKAAVTSTHNESSAAAYNATLPGAISTSTTAYSFTSYGSGTGSPQYGTGQAKFVSQADGWTTVLVTANSIDGFVGNSYKVYDTTIDTNTYYQLYTTGGVATGIYVKVASHTYTEGEVNTYNATLPGAVSEGDTKIDTPACLQYKVIKVVAP